MPVEVVSYMLSSQNILKRLQFMLILQCAPFFKGLKIACITNIEKNTCRELNAVLAGTGVTYRILSMYKEKCLVFLYRRSDFEAYLAQEEVRGFLEEYGYDLSSVEHVLETLSDRVCQYSGRDMGFPHEIGAFLDYPIEDVRGFIREAGKNSLLSGYWKVYHNPGKARLTFHAYDKARMNAVNEFLMGKPMRDIVQKIA